MALTATRAAVEPKWTNAFWFWNGSARGMGSHQPVEVLYVQVGRLDGSGNAWAHLPPNLPHAQDYWLVYRYDDSRRSLPPATEIQKLAASYAALSDAGRKRGLAVVGIQLDIDSPTSALPEYATYLRLLRKRLPVGTSISITALLDWFRPGTGVGDLIKETDEYIPQFYDLEPSGPRPISIAARIDPKRWGPVFNQYNRPFRVGISTFGRAREIRLRGPYSQANVELVSFSPLELASNPGLRRSVTRTDAQELNVTYLATKDVRSPHLWFEAGTKIELVMATPESIHAAVVAAKQMGGKCIGTAFFRWPAFNEGLAARPEEILREAGISVAPRTTRDLLRAEDGGCAAVACTELYLDNGAPLSDKPIHYEIESSEPMDYFLPAERAPVKLSDRTHLSVILPPYPGRSSLALGRAVVSRPGARQTLKFVLMETSR